MTVAIFGLLGVVIGGILNGLVAARIEHRREFREAIVAARLVRHELELLRAEFEHFLRMGLGSAYPKVPLEHPAWDRHRADLARVLPAIDWEMVQAAYTWIELHNTDPSGLEANEAISPGLRELYEDATTEMRGGGKSLLALTEGRRPRVSLPTRWRRRRLTRQEESD